MKHGAHLLRYLLLIRRLKFSGPQPYERLRDYLLSTEVADFADGYSQRSLQRDIQTIRTLFGTEIRNIKGCYQVLEEGDEESNQRLLEAFELQEFFRLPAALAPFVQLERRRALGLEHLRPLLRAAQQRQWVRFDYRKFWEDASAPREVAPLLLKEFRGRWYLLGQDADRQALRCFGLDRVQQLEMMPRHFTPPPDFDAESYYQHSFGIIRPDNEEPQRVVLSLEPDQGQYVKSYPLHQSQRVLVDTDAELRVELTVYTTHDLLMELLSMGERVQVLEPRELQQQIHTVYEQGLMLASSAAEVRK